MNTHRHWLSIVLVSAAVGAAISTATHMALTGTLFLLDDIVVLYMYADNNLLPSFEESNDDNATKGALRNLSTAQTSFRESESYSSKPFKYEFIEHHGTTNLIEQEPEEGSSDTGYTEFEFEFEHNSDAFEFYSNSSSQSTVEN